MSESLAYVIVLLLGVVVAFFCGSVPFALVVGKGIYGVDVREYGSGNIGATNVARTLGAGPGVVVMLLDAAKGAVGVLLMMLLASGFEALALGGRQTMLSVGWTHDVMLLAASFSTILGHVFSPFLGFHGGKGASTAFGSVLVIMPIAALIAFVTFVVVGLLTRHVSLGSLSAAVSLPILTALFYSTSVPYMVFSILVCVVVFVAHRGNIVRLVHHEERSISLGGGHEPLAADAMRQRRSRRRGRDDGEEEDES
jgi:glycerol-3-phosphate acyltransferase PlsY